MLISAENATFGFGGETLLENIRFTLSEGDRIGLIGANGEGKTTLLRLILGELDPDQGEIFRKNGIKIGYLAQNGGYDSENTVFEEMKELFREDLRAIEKLRETEKAISLSDESSAEYRALSAKYESLVKFVSARDSYNFEVKIRTVLNGMGFADAYGQKISTMSGGEKTRLKLARLLLEVPDLLILDEPTNHLDVKTLFWLEEYLSGFKGAILTVSHDRYFLDKTVREIYELERKRLSAFKGNYSKYKILKAEKTARILKEYEKQQEEIAHLQDYVNRNLVRATTAKSAQSRVKQLEKMELIEKPLPPPTPPRFFFEYSERPYEEVLKISGLKLVAGDKILLENADLSLRRGEKCAVVGDNGTGKSTLVKEIVGGKNQAVKTGRFVKIACYDQENANLDPEKTVLAELWERHVLWEQKKVRNILAQVKLGEDDIDKKVKMLSGGEKAKLALAVFECEGGNFLILDEPTNHLDLAARESLEEALKAFDGTVLFVSHDRYFIEAIAGKIIELDDGKINVFSGSYHEFREMKTAQKSPIPPSQPQKKEEKPQVGYRSKEERAKESQKRVRIKQIEEEIGALETEELQINDDLAKPEIAGNFALLTEKCNRLEQVKNKLDELYEEYETLI